MTSRSSFAKSETGLTNGDLVEVRTNLKAGEKVITKGSLFIDRAASGT